MSAVACQNCKRIPTPPVVRVVLLVEGRANEERRLCTACLRHVIDTAIREPAPWLGTRLVPEPMRAMEAQHAESVSRSGRGGAR